MKPSKKLIGVSIIAIVFIAVVLLNISTQNACKKGIEKNWGFTLPRECEEIFCAAQRDNLFGDGFGYHIFSIEDKNVEADIDTIPIENLSVEDKKEIEEAVKQLKIPNDKLPQGTDSYHLQVSNAGSAEDKLFILLNKEKDVFYVIESYY